MGVRYGVAENTARLFMHKVREAMKSSGNNPIDGEVHIDEFVVGGKETGKPGRSYLGKKKKVTVVKENQFSYAEIKETKIVISFKK
jgi:hypothetical protein